ncbi:MAG: hypothetical protein ACRC8S_20055 [Fimbriiglobus sp.]
MELYWIAAGLIGILVVAILVWSRRRGSEPELPPADESANLSTRTWIPHEDSEEDQRTSGA